MKIWVDADACPVVIKEILFRAAERSKVMVILVANQAISHPSSDFIRSMQVAQGFDVADNQIVRLCESGDLIITSDIPLAADVLAKHCVALTPHGERFTQSNIQARLTMRDFMDTLRGSGEHSGGPAPLSSANRRAFGNQLDVVLSKLKINKNS